MMLLKKTLSATRRDWSWMLAHHRKDKESHKSERDDYP